MIKAVKVVACGVFERELSALKEEGTCPLDIELLDAGLHSRPKELKVRLQDAIDRCEAGKYERISILYGLCGRGVIGLLTRATPVGLPRVHDCISLFLGSSQEYRQQFKAWPGTFYMTPGWFEKKAHPDQYRAASLRKEWCECDDPNYTEWSEKFG